MLSGLLMGFSTAAIPGITPRERKFSTGWLILPKTRQVVYCLDVLRLTRLAESSAASCRCESSAVPTRLRNWANPRFSVGSFMN